MELILAALLAGVMGSPHCVGMCGGFAAACARPRGSILLWHAGRLTTYAAMGVVGGLAGSVIPGPRWVAIAVSLVLLVWFAASLAELVPQPKIRVPGLVRAGVTLARREGPWARYLFGVATGLLPCGMVYAALALAIAAGRPLPGAAAMVAFGLGTVPALTLLSAGVRRFAARGVWQRRALADAGAGGGLVVDRAPAGGTHGTRRSCAGRRALHGPAAAWPALNRGPGWWRHSGAWFYYSVTGHSPGRRPRRAAPAGDPGGRSRRATRPPRPRATR